MFCREDLYLQTSETHTVDGRSPAPPWMYKTPVNNGISTISTGAGFLPSAVSLEIYYLNVP